MNSTAFDGQGFTEPERLPKTVERFAYPVVSPLSPGVAGLDVIIAVEIYPFQKQTGPISGSVTGTGPNTTTGFTTNVNYPDGTLVGATLRFVGGTAALIGQYQKITGYVAANGRFTTGAFSTPPADGDSFVVEDR